MKFFIAFVALVAVAAALPRNKPLTQIEEEFQAILDAIHSPSTDPATAQLLLEQLEALLGVEKPQEIETSPAIIDEEPETVEVPAPGPVILPAPAPAAPASRPSLVQIIINVDSASNVDGTVERPEPDVDGTVQRPEPEVDPTPVEVVEEPIASEPVVVSPLPPPPVVVIPDTLN